MTQPTSSATPTRRTPWQVTRSVWYAMFMREAVSRTMTDRMGWFWMIFEPLAFTLIMVGIRSFIRGDRLIVGADFIPWMIVGMMGFFLIREGMMRGLGAVEANSALFAYRQVQPIDPVLVRNFLEGMLRTFIFLLFIVGGLMLGLDINPDDAIGAFAWWASAWCLGLGLGLVVSVIANLVPEFGKVLRMITMPLLILSGVIFPLNHLPHWLLEYLMLNPIVHALELLRASFFEGYYVVHGTSATYFWMFTLSTLALGMLLHVRFKDKLKAK
ncbi:ABC transporter permease [Halomonas organivorans]|uniref:Transport permease protein n=1 Tax=Halomonas organivorans TaxID=257772 RepID=A0A7W5BXA9_9GAMM|nr:ABC transporter permease [Halomonas organivorans]MBB3140782.1 capsular polysaccharide transport system permease protein [Halomonas organivorans]